MLLFKANKLILVFQSPNGEKQFAACSGNYPSPSPVSCFLRNCISYWKNHSNGKFLLDSAHCSLGNTYKFALENGNLQRGIS